MVIWQFAELGGLPYFYVKIGGYVVIYISKDRTQRKEMLPFIGGGQVKMKKINIKKIKVHLNMKRKCFLLMTNHYMNI